MKMCLNNVFRRRQNYRISQNYYQDWKRPKRSFSPTITNTSQLNHIPQHNIQSFLNTTMFGDSTTSLGSAFQCLTTLSEK